MYVFGQLRRFVVLGIAVSGAVLLSQAAAWARVPTITCPADIVLSNVLSQCSAIAVFQPIADGAPPPLVLCAPPSGAVFPVGTNLVGCLASNKAGMAICSFSVIVKDIDPPSITCPADMAVECAGPTGTPVSFTASTADNCPGTTVLCAPPSGGNFPVGPTLVNCVATDVGGNTNACSFTVTVQDTTAPAITCPAIINAAEFPHDSGFAAVTWAAPLAVDICDGPLAVSCVPDSGSIFAVGSTNVNCVTMDAAGHISSCSFTVRVIPYRLPVTTSADDGPGSLRQALLDANDAPGENRIEFHLAGTGAQTIPVLSALPVVASPVILDGWTQAGSNGLPGIALGGSASGADGLVITAGSSTVRGLSIYGFATAIRVEINGGNIIQANYIGPDLSGANGENSGDGLYISSANNLVGGTAPELRNVISGNGGNGLHFATDQAFGNQVQGNFIGVASDGASPLPNGQHGILLDDGALRNSIGAPGNSRNIIAFNAGSGIALEATAGARNTISGNSIFSNGALGIDLGADGVTANDAGDVDEGPNRLQNFPDLLDVRSIDGLTSIDGVLLSAPNTLHRIEFFLNDTADPSGFGQGQRFVGSTHVLTDASGVGGFSAGFALSATFVQFISAVAMDQAGNSSEFSNARQVRTLPVLLGHTGNTNAATGTPVTLCAEATGTPPFNWQWRLNGANIPDATNACYTISSAQIANGGAYTVVVWNDLGDRVTIPSLLRLPLTTLNGSDNFTGRVALGGLSGSLSGSNEGATREDGEPLHAGKPGGKSIWYRWVAPVTGIATFGTKGSTFDTLLAVYTGTSVSALAQVASDEDRGGYFTSGLRFNAVSGMEYEIAIDGYYGAEGDFDLVWSEDDTPHLLPMIVLQPQSQTVPLGASVTFTSMGQRTCGQNGTNCPTADSFPGGQLPLISYQWFLNGTPIPGATASSLTVSNVQSQDVGDYTVQVSQQDPTHRRTVESDAASLQINVTGDSFQTVQSFDKLEDAINSEPLVLGAPVGLPPVAAPAGSHALAAAATVVRGYTGVQIFNTTSNTSQGETFCGVAGGASRWLSLLVTNHGHLIVNTDGSSYDTLLAVFTYAPSHSNALQLLGCDNNSGSNGITSRLDVPVEAGSTNLIGVDGVRGAWGVLQLNFDFCPDALMTPTGMSPSGAPKFQVNVRPGLVFNIQSSPDMVHWSTLLRTNSPTELFQFTDAGASLAGRRFYRTQLCP